MIRNSFIFLEKVGEKGEKILWESGIRSWDDFLSADKLPGISGKRKSYLDRQLLKAQKNLYAMNSEFFDNMLPPNEHWRLYDFFKEDACFLDIETNGLGSWSYITVVGLFDGVDTKIMIKDINLDTKALRDELKRYKMLVTFNGRCFDLPFIEKRYPGLLPKVPHFDVRFACSKLGLTGGLKAVEEHFGIRRNKVVEGMYGGDALRLWRMYKATGDDYYLNLLVEYNEEDIINLKTIANKVYGMMKEKSAGRA